MSEHIEPSEEYDFDAFLVASEQAVNEQNSNSLKQEECFRRLYTAIKATDTTVYVTDDSDLHEENFEKLCESVADELRAENADTELTDEQMQQVGHLGLRTLERRTYHTATYRPSRCGSNILGFGYGHKIRNEKTSFCIYPSARHRPNKMATRYK